MAAEAGRGKSALLVHWAQALIKRGGAHIVFVPISLRLQYRAGQCGVFPALAARLGEVHRRAGPGGKPLCRQGAASARLFDSLRLAGWQAARRAAGRAGRGGGLEGGAGPLPLAAAARRARPGQRALAGGRCGRARLAAPPGVGAPGAARAALPLPPLSAEGVRDVLRRMGNPLDALATGRMSTASWSLGEGDPLLVRLYVQALLPHGAQGASLRPRNLTTLQSGLTVPIFQKWWDDQRAHWGDSAADEGAERCAPCSICWRPRAGRWSKKRCWRSRRRSWRWTLYCCGRRCGPLARFVVGNGQRGSGYAFSHPRLGHFFHDQLTRCERARWEARFVELGRHTLPGAERRQRLRLRTPHLTCCSPTPAHLEHAHAPDSAFYALVSKGWLRAWEALEGTRSGFLNDAACAWQRADTALERGRARTGRPGRSACNAGALRPLPRQRRRAERQHPP